MMMSFGDGRRILENTANILARCQLKTTTLAEYMLRVLFMGLALFGYFRAYF